METPFRGILTWPLLVGFIRMGIGNCSVCSSRGSGIEHAQRDSKIYGFSGITTFGVGLSTDARGREND